MANERKLPIILIPGIQGTKLYNVNLDDFSTHWSGVKKFYTNIHKLKLQRDGINDIGVETIIERADVENMAYSEIINYLKSKGYRVFIFGYDWRKSNVDSARSLKKYVEVLRNKLNIGEFNFLTHSMGGLVLSAYLKILDDAERNKIVSKAIFTVPPFLGSIEASFNLVIGKSRLFNSSDDFRKIARTFPAVYELLPVFEDAYKFENPITEANYDPFNFYTYWQQVANADREDTIDKHEFMAYRLSKVREVRDQNNLIFDLSTCSPEFRKKCIVVCGGNEDTKSHIKVHDRRDHFKNFFDYEAIKEDEEGDGTVPHASASIFKDSVQTIRVGKKTLESWADSRMTGPDWHAFFLNNGRVQNVLQRFLKGDTHREDWYKSAGGRIEKIT
ncbi:hypothetical protein ULMS_06380 [Patiriisocius marinistellae]|uniref:Lecithin:cholesterol acyltransferase n=1 Tax=Patiriisocius marinistellae TaxID=2494560 RepID=A0A5J4FTT1_9FLAO|nr:alpha/beta hydrolase [Patiriisocius marinistellae]GEQ85130.1 hypothetical protein ULMS_06380 [Patiriisocius marinistellae]